MQHESLHKSTCSPSEETFCTHSQSYTSCVTLRWEKSGLHAVLSCFTLRLCYKKVLSNIKENIKNSVKAMGKNYLSSVWDTFANHLDRLQFLISHVSCTSNICTMGQILLFKFFLTFPLLSGAELLLAIVRTCSPFPTLHKGHPLTTDPFCMPNPFGKFTSPFTPDLVIKTAATHRKKSSL